MPNGVARTVVWMGRTDNADFSDWNGFFCEAHKKKPVHPAILSKKRATGHRMGFLSARNKTGKDVQHQFFAEKIC